MIQTIELLQQAPWFFYALVLVLSLLIGSFLNVVIYRLPKMMELGWQQEYQAYFHEGQATTTNATTAPAAFNLAVPRSCCPSCQTPIAARDNVPILSWLWLRGRCRHCGTKISARYPLVEGLTALLSVVVAWHFGPTFTTVVYLLVLWALIALTFIDLDKMLLPDQITLPLLWLALLYSLSDYSPGPADAIIGAAAGYLSLWTVYWGFKLLTGKEGMGYGDFKLLAVFGALLGWQQLPLIILLSSAVGAVVGISMILLQGRDKSSPIPFGPYIAAAGFIAMLYGEQLTQWYLRVLAP
ncbi:A24 family peptidase [Alkalimonas collagenimarina]|uniref:Prepilin leader peptidase/N-methyltransferase n=1 Tax=Alkalimonas collagenimarina TaxID=400390 RepID=A0ABT9GZM2_9GAMM|nr:A24 family peptidase [Alkalimonas collagenimarina]MDP4536473.1 A24 family peptidase [Alkalimonas collagenimarina]